MESGEAGQGINTSGRLWSDLLLVPAPLPPLAGAPDPPSPRVSQPWVRGVPLPSLPPPHPVGWSCLFSTKRPSAPAPWVRVPGKVKPPPQPHEQQPFLEGRLMDVS